MRFELISPNPYGLWLELTGKGYQPMISLIHQCLPVSPSIIGVCINITKSHQKFRKKIKHFCKKNRPSFLKVLLGCIYVVKMSSPHYILSLSDLLIFIFRKVNFRHDAPKQRWCCLEIKIIWINVLHLF
jgi:hypothetical protein